VSGVGFCVINEPVFRRHVVRSANAELDSRTHYIIGVMFNVRGEAGRVTHLVPMSERDPAWVEWLRRLEETQKAR
jgi:hypothetical protein